MKKVLQHDPVSGITEWFYHDEHTGISGVQTEQNVDGLMEANRREYNAEHGRWEEFKKVGSIPLTIYMEMVKTGAIKDQKVLRRFLNDPDYRNFRTRPGRV